MINPKLLQFLKGIKKNNTKEWYENHKEEYKDLRDEFSILLEGVRNEILTFDEAVKRNHTKGIETVKVFRIHKDTRFSHDKTKYKTSIAGLISADIHSLTEPVYYIAIEPGNKSFIGGGIRTPESEQLKVIREYIAIHYKTLRNILSDKKLVKSFAHGIEDETKLKTAPKGYDRNHPAIDLLQYKNFTIGEHLTDIQLSDKKLTKSLTQKCNALYSFNEFLRKAAQPR
jgi:uncharacterized protein (TIGR02453 family)